MGRPGTGGGGAQGRGVQGDPRGADPPARLRSSGCGSATRRRRRAWPSGWLLLGLTWRAVSVGPGRRVSPPISSATTGHPAAGSPWRTAGACADPVPPPQARSRACLTWSSSTTTWIWPIGPWRRRWPRWAPQGAGLKPVLHTGNLSGTGHVARHPRPWVRPSFSLHGRKSRRLEGPATPEKDCQLCPPWRGLCLPRLVPRLPRLEDPGLPFPPLPWELGQCPNKELLGNSVHEPMESCPGPGGWGRAVHTSTVDPDSWQPHP